MKKYTSHSMNLILFILLQNISFCIDPVTSKEVEGCMDPSASNYNWLATKDNNSCEYELIIYGCMDQKASNYDSKATIDNYRCVYKNNDISGC